MDLRWDDSGFAERCDSYIDELAGVLGHADRHLSFRHFVGQPPWSSDGLLASMRSSRSGSRDASHEPLPHDATPSKITHNPRKFVTH
jgi:hypothetical protein